MAPRPENPGDDFPYQAPDDSKLNSVFIPLFLSSDDELSVLLTLRSRNMAHGGQISFPGGQIEKGETARSAAIRETCEEIHCQKKDILIAGKLSSLYLHRTNNLIEPFAGKLDTQPDLTISNREVEEIIPVPVCDLLEEKNMVREKWILRDGAVFDVPFWGIHEVPLWGATAMILSELLHLYGEFKNG
ncbi:MAG: NUDIX hydrolase [Balneolaceae bacterium]